MPLILLVILAVSLSIDSGFAIEETSQKTAALSLSELAAKADLVAVAQVKDTDYVYTRAFPSEGSAYLKILIAYKHNQPDEDIVEVYDKGLHPNECYFENPSVLEEGRRFLVFFRRDPQDPQTYRGLAEGCALEILVAGDNRYALKHPVTGIDLTDDLRPLVAEYDFRDNYALVADEDLTPAVRDEMLTDGSIIPYQDEYKYTRGVDLSAIRKLISSEALKTKNNW
jgi:hypothetical protein